jgi:hypothetical protein
MILVFDHHHLHDRSHVMLHVKLNTGNLLQKYDTQLHKCGNATVYLVPSLVFCGCCAAETVVGPRVRVIDENLNNTRSRYLIR